jgi:hypothetical protein
MYDQFIDLNLGIMTLEAMILQFLEHVIILAIYSFMTTKLLSL